MFSIQNAPMDYLIKFVINGKEKLVFEAKEVLTMAFQCKYLQTDPGLIFGNEIRISAPEFTEENVARFLAIATGEKGMDHLPSIDNKEHLEDGVALFRLAETLQHEEMIKALEDFGKEARERDEKGKGENDLAAEHLHILALDGTLQTLMNEDRITPYDWVHLFENAMEVNPAMEEMQVIEKVSRILYNKITTDPQYVILAPFIDILTLSEIEIVQLFEMPDFLPESLSVSQLSAIVELIAKNLSLLRHLADLRNEKLNRRISEMIESRLREKADESYMKIRDELAAQYEQHVQVARTNVSDTVDDVAKKQGELSSMMDGLMRAREESEFAFEKEKKVIREVAAITRGLASNCSTVAWDTKIQLFSKKGLYQDVTFNGTWNEENRRVLFNILSGRRIPPNGWQSPVHRSALPSIRVEFNAPVVISSYSISSSGKRQYGYMDSWKLEGLRYESDEWDILHCTALSTDLASSKENTYACAHHGTHYRAVMLSMTARDSKNQQVMHFKSWKLFGSVVPEILRATGSSSQDSGAARIAE